MSAVNSIARGAGSRASCEARFLAIAQCSKTALRRFWGSDYCEGRKNLQCRHDFLRETTEVKKASSVQDRRVMFRKKAQVQTTKKARSAKLGNSGGVSPRPQELTETSCRPRRLQLTRSESLAGYLQGPPQQLQPDEYLSAPCFLYLLYLLSWPCHV